MSASESGPVAMVEEIRKSLPPGHEWTERELALWEVERDRIMDGYGGPPGTRPWAFWKFDLGEEPPRPSDDDDYVEFRALEAVRLAELGERAAPS